MSMVAQRHAPILLGVVLVVMIVASSVFIRYQTKHHLRLAHVNDFIFVLKQACEHSITASNTLNPVLALSEATKSYTMLYTLRILQSLHGFGEFTNDVARIFDIVSQQKQALLTQLLGLVPDQIPKTASEDVQEVWLRTLGTQAAATEQKG